MPQDRSPTFSIAVFPFLKTSARSSIGQHVIRSTDDLEDLPDEQSRAVAEITRILYLQNELRVKSASYVITPPIDLAQPYLDAMRLEDTQAVVAYLYASPHELFGTPLLSTEHASLAVFTPGQVPAALAIPEYEGLTIGEQPPMVKDARGEVPGHAGLYNFRHSFWVTRHARLYGPQPHMTLNYSQDLAGDLERARAGDRAYRFLLGELLTEPLTKNNERILTSVRWFNESNRAANNAYASVVCLAIAFESLLGLPASEKTDRLVDSIALLLGRVPRVDVWAAQFYKARSAIVHEGRTDTLRLVATDSRQAASGKACQSLVSYGTRIFRLCLSTLVVGSSLAQRAGLGDLFITNEERFRTLSRLLGGTSADCEEPWERAAALCNSIEEHKFLHEDGLRLQTIVDAVRLGLQAWLREHPSLAAEGREKFSSAVARMRAPNEMEQLEALRQLSDAPSQRAKDDDLPTRVVGALIESAWFYLSTHYYWLKRARDDKLAEENEEA